MGGRSMDAAMGPRLQAAWRVAVRETKVMLISAVRAVALASIIPEQSKSLVAYMTFSGDGCFVPAA